VKFDDVKEDVSDFAEKVHAKSDDVKKEAKTARG
jgi:hypothetical protein